MEYVDELNWNELLTFLLAQRLELNALESALKTADILSDDQIRQIRTATSETAKAWSTTPGDDVMALLRVHSSPFATMGVPPRRDVKREE